MLAEARAQELREARANRRLKIGLSACFSHADPTRSFFTGKTLQYVEQSVAHWLMSSGAMVVMVPCPTGSTARGDVTYEHYAQWLDGLVLHGGSDVWPGSYGEVPMEERWAGDRIRDEYDQALVAAFVAQGKPVFGICRGLQLLNVAFGGTLWQDINTQVPESLVHRDAAIYDNNYHSIDIVPGTRLAALYPGVQRVRVNSIHHQGIKRLADEFVVEAVSHSDGVIEAIRRKDAGASYIAAVQWHPEWHQPGLSESIDDTALLRDFLGAVSEAKARAG
ncbi:gamma-glutamyl-gamma-aminobutyrate hydrolase family protein [Ramlibacter rhizophilus]|uniref:Gamma-glutamyl-gamma-aminobutyrate hydrolase family protein n=1 Tax=Ramlibacter rhizophilus TaxID=1781167 RepID=A0A4Z0BGP7_9BURK|nr:type 1 glutamine amidotransferase [Ramlibacter rhizophilus]TFY97921.1 gamma-glutamyl-gamma-aminobutyrate hydrolase family protein [Ramlibacter rhizophilus]